MLENGPNNGSMRSRLRLYVFRAVSRTGPIISYHYASNGCDNPRACVCVCVCARVRVRVCVRARAWARTYMHSLNVWYIYTRARAYTHTKHTHTHTHTYIYLFIYLHKDVTCNTPLRVSSTPFGHSILFIRHKFNCWCATAASAA